MQTGFRVPKVVNLRTNFRALRVNLQTDGKAALEASLEIIFHRSEIRPSQIASNIGTNGTKIIRAS